MTISDDEDETLAQFLESEVLSEVSDEEKPKTEPPSKKLRVEEVETSQAGSRSKVSGRIESGTFSRIPSELFHRILKFLSSEDLVACSLVCKFMNYAASDESLWRRLYCMRWGLSAPSKKLCDSAWKKLYIQRDGEDMVEFVRNTPSEFKEYYIQMQAAKRSQAPLPSQVNDDHIILDKTLADQVFTWKSSRGLTDELVAGHSCSGETCTYYQIGDVFVCEKTGRVHVCDDTCREVILDATSQLLVCTISGHCFDRMLSPGEMEPDAEQQQGGVTDEAEPFMGSGRFARAYLLGYNCADEEELERTLSQSFRPVGVDNLLCTWIVNKMDFLPLMGSETVTVWSSPAVGEGGFGEFVVDGNGGGSGGTFERWMPEPEVERSCEVEI
ncbi:hypothetical protein NE237_027055 [Protea cynaroides]|uniref:F-box domain-containing protein n=1 Tax=Protea cynaroides TaxID=273540 RepID=A0A9Q0JU20_9MAGN|nr:hypothetical protein NE237_027055 [Protea cynaroides]